tara:strand:+ start:532 stop:1050 length:519 start_codon:yes stop_codon:yes gene_type:complete
MNKNYIFKRNYFKIYDDKKIIKGKLKKYEVIYFGPRVGVILKNKSKILLVKQYRYLTDEYSLEIPGGSVAEGENLEDAANRELCEESGINIKKFKHLIDYYPGLDNVDNKTSIFFSEVDGKINLPSKKFETDEIDSIHWFGINECIELVKSGVILDAMTSIGILALREFNLK